MPEHQPPKTPKALVTVVYEDGREDEVLVPPNRDPVLYLCGKILGGQQKIHDRIDKVAVETRGIGGKLSKHLDRHKMVMWTVMAISSIAAGILLILDLYGRL